MDNIKYLPLGLFFAFATKTVCFGASFQDVAALLVMGGVSVFYEYRSNSKKIKELEKQLENYSSKQTEQSEIIEQLRTYVSSMKIAQGFKRNG